MNGSILIFGGNKELRQRKLHYVLEQNNLKETANNPDLLFIENLEEKKSIGIDQIKEGIKFLGKKPFQNTTKALVINKADLLTNEAQNSLLKTLEEPPEYALIVLISKTENALLPTVISRCIKMPLKSAESTQEENILLEELLKSQIGKRLVWAEENAKEDKEDVIELLETWLDYLHLKLRKEHSTEALKNTGIAINNITKVKDDLERTNLNLKLALEWLMVNLVETRPNFV